MSVICEDIFNPEDVQIALFGSIASMVHVKYIGENKLPGIDATKLAPCVLPVLYKEIANDIEAMKAYEDDVYVTSFPKSGTTWTQEMVWLIANDLNYDVAKKISIMERYNFIELSAILSEFNVGYETNSVNATKKMPRPRFIKSHLPVGLLPTDIWTVKPKLVYVARNPKDTVVSYYNHWFNLHRYNGTKEYFFDAFLNDLTCWSPHSDHVLDYWELRNEPNVLFLTYEEMSKDLQSVLRKVAKFFNKTFTDDQFTQLAKHLSFKEMRENRAANYEALIEELEKQYGGKRIDPNFRFCRRGEVNSAKDEMSEEYQKKFDDWMAVAFKHSDFTYNI